MSTRITNHQPETISHSDGRRFNSFQTIIAPVSRSTTLAERPLSEIVRERVISQATCMEMVFEFVAQVASEECDVLITGEPGVGKGLLAKAIHDSSLRAAEPFIVIDVATLPAENIESELFGDVKEAFSGADVDRTGCFETAGHGTVFLKQIGSLPLLTQEKLISVIENRVVTPLGEIVPRDINARIIISSSHDMKRLVSHGIVNPDLHDRLSVFHVHLPPLKNRPGDILPLVEHFIKRNCQRSNRLPLQVNRELMLFLDAYAWPGNVRQLHNCMEEMVALSSSNVLTLADLPRSLCYIAESINDEAKLPHDFTLAELEKAAILQVLKRCNGNRTHAANKLDISVRTLQRKLARWKTEAELRRDRPESA